MATIVSNDFIHFFYLASYLPTCKKISYKVSFERILCLLVMYFDAMVVDVKTFLLLFRLALAIL